MARIFQNGQSGAAMPSAALTRHTSAYPMTQPSATPTAYAAFLRETDASELFADFLYPMAEVL